MISTEIDLTTIERRPYESKMKILLHITVDDLKELSTVSLHINAFREKLEGVNRGRIKEN